MQAHCGPAQLRIQAPLENGHLQFEGILGRILPITIYDRDTYLTHSVTELTTDVYQANGIYFVPTPVLQGYLQSW